MHQFVVDRAVFRDYDLSLARMTIAIPYGGAMLSTDVGSKILRDLRYILTMRHQTQEQDFGLMLHVRHVLDSGTVQN